MLRGLRLEKQFVCTCPFFFLSACAGCCAVSILHYIDTPYGGVREMMKIHAENVVFKRMLILTHNSIVRCLLTTCQQPFDIIFYL